MCFFCRRCPCVFSFLGAGATLCAAFGVLHVFLARRVNFGGGWEEEGSKSDGRWYQTAKDSESKHHSQDQRPSVTVSTELRPIRLRPISVLQGTSLVSRLCGSRLGVCAHPFVKTARFPRGSHPQVQSLRGERVDFPKNRSLDLSSCGLLSERDPTTQKILIHCDSSVHGKRSCQALETNSGSRSQKLSFPDSYLNNFRLAILQELVRAVMFQRTLTRNSRTALVASRSRKPTATAQNSSNWAPSFPKRPTFAKLRRFGCDCEE